jgi:hypothetical protein
MSPVASNLHPRASDVAGLKDGAKGQFLPFAGGGPNNCLCGSSPVMKTQRHGNQDSHPPRKRRWKIFQKPIGDSCQEQANADLIKSIQAFRLGPDRPFYRPRSKSRIPGHWKCCCLNANPGVRPTMKSDPARRRVARQGVEGQGVHGRSSTVRMMATMLDTVGCCRMSLFGGGF